MYSAFGVDHGDISKADEPKKASTGRIVAGGLFPGYHGAFAGKKGAKLKAVGNEAGGAFAGNVAGQAAGLLVTRGRSANARIAGRLGGAGGGAYAGGALGTQRAQRKGHYKDQS